MTKKKSAPGKSKRVKAVARKRIGTVPAARHLDERQTRWKPKHKKPIDTTEEF